MKQALAGIGLLAIVGALALAFAGEEAKQRGDAKPAAGKAITDHAAEQAPKVGQASPIQLRVRQEAIPVFQPPHPPQMDIGSTQATAPAVSQRIIGPTVPTPQTEPLPPATGVPTLYGNAPAPAIGPRQRNVVEIKPGPRTFVVNGHDSAQRWVNAEMPKLHAVGWTFGAHQNVCHISTADANRLGVNPHTHRPTFIIVDESNRVRAKHYGYLTAKEFADWRNSMGATRFASRAEANEPKPTYAPAPSYTPMYSQPCNTNCNQNYVSPTPAGVYWSSPYYGS